MIFKAMSLLVLCLNRLPVLKKSIPSYWTAMHMQLTILYCAHGDVGMVNFMLCVFFLSQLKNKGTLGISLGYKKE